MLKNTVKSAALALIMVMALAIPAFAGAAGKFTATEGRVDILRPGMSRAVPVAAGAEVSEGDIVRTKSGAFAEIRFVDGTVLRLTESSRIEIKEYLMRGDKRENGTLRLLRGKVRATVSKGLGRVIPVIYSGPSTFRIETPTAVAGVKGTDFFVFYSMGATGVFVLEGAVDTAGTDAPGTVVRVRGGQYSVVERGRPATPAAAARQFVMARHLKDAEGRERSKEGRDDDRREDRDRKDLIEKSGDGGDLEARRRDRDDRDDHRRRDRDEKREDDRRRDRDHDHDRDDDFREYGKYSVRDASWEHYDRYADRDGDRYYEDRYEHDHHDYDRPISETNTALLSSSFKGLMTAASLSGPLAITSEVEGKFRDDRTWWAEFEGVFTNGGSRTDIGGSISGTTNAGPFSGTLSNGSWETSIWSAEVSGTLPGGTFTGTMSGTHDAASSGKLKGTGGGTWTQ